MNHPAESVVIIGGGLGGGKAAEALREQGYRGSISLISNEADAPYERPPLSKAISPARLPSRMHSSTHCRGTANRMLTYACRRLRRHSTRTGTRSPSVTARRWPTTSCSSLPVRSRVSLRVPGADADNVLYLRRHADADAIRTTFGDGRRLVIIGAGWIGLEVAAAARGAEHRRGHCRDGRAAPAGSAGTRDRTDVRRSARCPWSAALPRRRARRDHRRGGRASGVRLADGTMIPADAVVVGVGVTPDVALAEAAGLTTDNGVLVDASLRTSDPDVYAVGDIANQAHPTLGHPGAGRALGHGAESAGHRSRRDARLRQVRTASTPNCPTSSAISTTWGWNTSATPRETSASRDRSGRPCRPRVRGVLAG